MNTLPFLRKTPKIPNLCLHKASGRAVVCIDGKDHYYGRTARIVDSNHLRDGATLNGNGAGHVVSVAPVRYASEKQLALI
jgi:hypothetical protein